MVVQLHGCRQQSLWWYCCCCCSCCFTNLALSHPSMLYQLLTRRAWSCSCIAAVSSASGGAAWHSASSSPHSCAETLREVKALSCRQQHAMATSIHEAAVDHSGSSCKAWMGHLAWHAGLATEAPPMFITCTIPAGLVVHLYGTAALQLVCNTYSCLQAV